MVIDGKDITSRFHVEAKKSPLLKVFGDLESFSYRIPGREWNLDSKKHLQLFLTSILSQDVLMIGYDPIWDEPIESFFPSTGKKLTYVNEELPPEKSHIAQAIKQRK